MPDNWLKSQSCMTPQIHGMNTVLITGDADPHRICPLKTGYQRCERMSGLWMNIASI
jgi:hypothetical protein